MESYSAHNCFFFVFGYKLPKYMVVVFEWVHQTIVVSGLYQMLHFFILQNLLSGCLFLFFGHLHQIQLIAKGTCGCNNSSCLKRSRSSGLMVRAYADMCAHCTYGISEGCTILDFQSVNSICIVTAPDLRRIVKHSRLKSSASA